MPVVIRPAQTLSDANAVFRLRYEVYVDELQRTQRYANHEERIIREPLDENSLLLCAFEGTRLVGTVRTNYARSGSLGEYDALYGMSSVGTAHPVATSITTKLLVAHDYRNSSLAYRLAAAAYQTALYDGIQYDFVDVYPARIPFFERLGYRVHIPEVVHSEFGSVMVMKIAVRDVEHMRAVRSPLLRYATQATMRLAA